MGIVKNSSWTTTLTRADRPTTVCGFLALGSSAGRAPAPTYTVNASMPVSDTEATPLMPTPTDKAGAMVKVKLMPVLV